VVSVVVTDDNPVATNPCSGKRDVPGHTDFSAEPPNWRFAKRSVWKSQTARGGPCLAKADNENWQRNSLDCQLGSMISLNGLYKTSEFGTAPYDCKLVVGKLNEEVLGHDRLERCQCPGAIEPPVAAGIENMQDDVYYKAYARTPAASGVDSESELTAAEVKCKQQACDDDDLCNAQNIKGFSPSVATFAAVIDTKEGYKDWVGTWDPDRFPTCDPMSCNFEPPDNFRNEEANVVFSECDDDARVSLDKCVAGSTVCFSGDNAEDRNSTCEVYCQAGFVPGEGLGHGPDSRGFLCTEGHYDKVPQCTKRSCNNTAHELNILQIADENTTYTLACNDQDTETKEWQAVDCDVDPGCTFGVVCILTCQPEFKLDYYVPVKENELQGGSVDLECGTRDDEREADVHWTVPADVWQFHNQSWPTVPKCIRRTCGMRIPDSGNEGATEDHTDGCAGKLIGEQCQVPCKPGYKAYRQDLAQDGTDFNPEDAWSMVAVYFCQLLENCEYTDNLRERESAMGFDECSVYRPGYPRALLGEGNDRKADGSCEKQECSSLPDTLFSLTGVASIKCTPSPTFSGADLPLIREHQAKFEEYCTVTCNTAQNFILNTDPCVDDTTGTCDAAVFTCAAPADLTVNTDVAWSGPNGVLPKCEAVKCEVGPSAMKESEVDETELSCFPNLDATPPRSPVRGGSTCTLKCKPQSKLRPSGVESMELICVNGTFHVSLGDDEAGEVFSDRCIANTADVQVRQALQSYMYITMTHSEQSLVDDIVNGGLNAKRNLERQKFDEAFQAAVVSTLGQLTPRTVISADDVIEIQVARGANLGTRRLAAITLLNVRRLAVTSTLFVQYKVLVSDAIGVTTMQSAMKTLGNATQNLTDALNVQLQSKLAAEGITITGVIASTVEPLPVQVASEAVAGPPEDDGLLGNTQLLIFIGVGILALLIVLVGGAMFMRSRSHKGS